MRRGSLFSLVTMFILSGCVNSPTFKHSPALAQPVYSADGADLDLQVDQQIHRRVIPLPLEDERTDVNLGSGREPIPVCVMQDVRETCITLEPDVPQDMVLRFAGGEKTLRFSYLGPQAQFSEAYQAAHRGKIDIEVPRAYELVNVGLSLTPYAAENPGLTASSPYLDDVRSYFAEHADAAFVQRLDELMREDASSYHTLKMNGAAFDLADDNTLTRSEIYRSSAWTGNDLLPLMEDMQAFAQSSDFSKFYAAHAQLYASQIAYLRDAVDVPGMIAWLGEEFPDVAPYDHTRILFSPLVGYNQSLKTFDEDGFRQSMPHVNFPYPADSDAQLSRNALAVYRGLILFTELNHGYINPTIEPYSGKIEAVMPDLPLWAGNETAAGYGNGTGIFTEMTNWALVSVHAYDVLPEAEADQIAERVERIMIRNRGFTRFDKFQARLLALSRSQPANESLADVFPQLVASLPDMLSE